METPHVLAVFGRGQTKRIEARRGKDCELNLGLLV